MFVCVPSAIPSTGLEFFDQVRSYLNQRKDGLLPNQDLEAAWKYFYDCHDHKIRAFAFNCGASSEDVADCAQEVWRELLVRLPTFQLDHARGQFNTWLFSIVKGKVADFYRDRNRRLLQTDSECLLTVADMRPSLTQALEDNETIVMVWGHLKKRLSKCNFQVLWLRLMGQRPVAEVAETLGLSHEQVWYRYHRARRNLEEIGSILSRGERLPAPVEDLISEENEKYKIFAQGKDNAAVSPHVGLNSPVPQGGNSVDYVFQRLELGRRELNPEWKVEWNCDTVPRPVLHIRKMAIVAYAEMCGTVDTMTAYWPRIVNAAIAAGVLAGIATIIATPTTVLPIFQTEFRKQMQSKAGGQADVIIHIALSAKIEANGPWCVCKD